MQNSLRFTLLVPWLLFSCAAVDPRPIPESLVQEIQAMATDDQRWEHLVMDGDPRIREDGFFADKKKLQLERAQRCQEIFNTHGLPTPERVGSEAASSFWILVQHADELVELQSEVLEAIEAGPADAFNATELAYLTDRVRVNTGRPQVFGTQMAYDGDQARAYPKTVEDPARVDERRAEVGMEPLVEYANNVCESHFEMNRAHYANKGIVEPFQYASDFAAWK